MQQVPSGIMSFIDIYLWASGIKITPQAPRGNRGLDRCWGVVYDTFRKR